MIKRFTLDKTIIEIDTERKIIKDLYYGICDCSFCGELDISDIFGIIQEESIVKIFYLDTTFLGYHKYMIAEFNFNSGFFVLVNNYCVKEVLI